MCKTNSPIMKIKACEDCKNSEALIFDVIYCFMYNEHFIVLHISNNILLDMIQWNGVGVSTYLHKCLE